MSADPARCDPIRNDAVALVTSMEGVLFRWFRRRVESFPDDPRAVAAELYQQTAAKVAHGALPHTVAAAWVWTVAKNVLRDWVRRQSRQIGVASSNGDPTNELDDGDRQSEPDCGRSIPPDRAMRAREMLNVVGRDPDAELLVAVGMGYTPEEISAGLSEPAVPKCKGDSPGAIRVRLSRARQRLARADC